MPRSSSGLGHWVFIPEITGSTPVRGTDRDFEAGFAKIPGEDIPTNPTHIWSNNGADQPVTVTGKVGTIKGVDYFNTKEGTGALPETQLTPLLSATGASRTPFDWEKPTTPVVDTSPNLPKMSKADRAAFMALPIDERNPNMKINMRSIEPSGSNKPAFPPSQLGSSKGLPPLEDPFATSQNFTGEAQRTYPINSNPSAIDTLENQKRNIQLDKYDIKTPQDKAQINSTLNGYGIKGPFENQLQAVNDKVTQLGRDAKGIVTAQGGMVAKSDLVNLTAKNLAYGAGHNIPIADAPSTATQYINKVYAKVVGVDPNNLEGYIAPDQIPGSVVQDMKKIMNKDSNSTFDQPDPLKWSSDQTTSRYARNATDTILDTQYPTASHLNNDMSDLIKSQDSLRKGANQESGMAQKTANQPQPNMLQKAWANPWVRYPVLGLGFTEGKGAIDTIGKTAMLGVGMASNALNDKSNPPFGSSGKIAGGVAGRIINDITNTPNQPVQTKTLQSQPNNIKQDNSNNNNSVHTRTIPQSAAEVQPDPKTGTFTPIDPQQFKGADKKPLALSGAQITQAQGELEAMAKDKIKMSEPAYASAVGKAQALFDAKKTASDDLNAWSQGMKSTATKFNNVLSQLQNKDVSVGLQNAFGSGGFSLNDLKKLNDPKYSSLITGLNTLQQEGLMPGDSLSGSATLDVWKQDLQLAYAQQEAPYDAHLMTYVGGNSQPQGTLPPVSGSVGNQFINQGTPPSSGNLPTISGTPQTGSLKNSSSLLPFSTVYYEFR